MTASCLRCGEPRPAKNSTYCSTECQELYQAARVTDEDLEAVERAASSGFSELSIARLLGIRSKTTFIKLKRSDQRVVDAIERGRSKLGDALVNAQIRRALDLKHPQGFLAAAQVLNVMFGWRESRSVEVDQRVKVELVLPAALTEEQYSAAFPASRPALDFGDDDAE